MVFHWSKGTTATAFRLKVVCHYEALIQPKASYAFANEEQAKIMVNNVAAMQSASYIVATTNATGQGSSTETVEQAAGGRSKSTYFNKRRKL